MNLLSSPTMAWIIPLLFLYKDGFGIKVNMPLKIEKKQKT